MRLKFLCQALETFPRKHLAIAFKPHQNADKELIKSEAMRSEDNGLHRKTPRGIPACMGADIRPSKKQKHRRRQLGLLCPDNHSFGALFRKTAPAVFIYRQQAAIPFGLRLTWGY